MSLSTILSFAVISLLTGVFSARYRVLSSACAAMLGILSIMADKNQGSLKTLVTNAVIFRSCDCSRFKREETIRNATPGPKGTMTPHVIEWYQTAPSLLHHNSQRSPNRITLAESFTCMWQHVRIVNTGINLLLLMKVRHFPLIYHTPCRRHRGV